MDTAVSVSHIQESGSERDPSFPQGMTYGGGVYGVCGVYMSVVYVCLWYVGLCMSVYGVGGGLCIGLQVCL